MGISGSAGSRNAKNSVTIEQPVAAPPEEVSRYVLDFRTAKDWMVGVESVQSLGDDEYRLRLDTPVGKLEPGVRVTERADSNISWVYTSKVEGGGRVHIEPDGQGCKIRYTGEFRPKSKLLGRAARLAGMESFARNNGERSLTRLKALMEAGRYR